jgi:hypothetical protein
MSRALCLLWLVASTVIVGSAACSAPNLEDPRCADAQDAVKRFYSLHFDRNGLGTLSNMETRAFLADRLAGQLADRPDSGPDYFTVGDIFPKAFRVGTCTVRGDRNADVEVLLLWRTEEKSEQRRVVVSTVSSAGRWLIESVAAH